MIYPSYAVSLGGRGWNIHGGSCHGESLQTALQKRAQPTVSTSYSNDYKSFLFEKISGEVNTDW